MRYASLWRYDARVSPSAARPQGCDLVLLSLGRSDEVSGALYSDLSYDLRRSGRQLFAWVCTCAATRR